MIFNGGALGERALNMAGMPGVCTWVQEASTAVAMSSTSFEFGRCISCLSQTCQEVIKFLWSQVYSLSADVVIPTLEGAPRDDDTDAKELLEILEQADMIKKGGARFEVHQQVQIAAVLPVAEGAGHLAPVAGIIRAVPGQRTGRIGRGGA
jgi:hypothetical protein